MAGERPERVNYVPVGAILLIFLGVVFLLQALGVLSWGLWGVLWRFWPVWLIAVGLGILLRHQNPWLVSGLLLLLLFACLIIAIGQYSGVASGVIAETYTVPRAGLERARVNINLAAGRLILTGLPAGSGNLAEVDYGVRGGQPSLKTGYSSFNGEGDLSLATPSDETRLWGTPETRWAVRLAPGVPTALNVTVSAGDANLDLRALTVPEFQMQLAATNGRVVLPEAGDTNISVKADVTNLDIIIPEGTAARIRTNTGLTLLDVDETRFPPQGEYYQSPGFTDAPHRLELELDAAVSIVRVR